MEKAEKESEKIERPKTQTQAVPSCRHSQAATKPRSRLRSSRPVPPLNVVVDPRRAQPGFSSSISHRRRSCHHHQFQLIIAAFKCPAMLRYLLKTPTPEAKLPPLLFIYSSRLLQ
jgi:hypothetical protein